MCVFYFLCFRSGVILGEEDISKRIVSVKKRGSKDLIGVLIYLDKDVLVKLEDIACVFGSVDRAVSDAIESMHSTLFGEEEKIKPGISKVDEEYVKQIVDRIETRISRLLASMAAALPPVYKPIEVEEVSIITSDEGGEDVEEAVPDIDEVLEDIAIVEMDESLIVGEAGSGRGSKKEKRKKA